MWRGLDGVGLKRFRNSAIAVSPIFDRCCEEQRETARDVRVRRGGLDDDPRPGPIATHDREARGLRLVDVNANMVYGWPLLSAALSASVLSWG